MVPVRAMVLDAPRDAAAGGRAAGAGAGPRPGAAARPRLRRLPDRPARHRRRGRRRRARRWSSATRSSAERTDTGERVGVPWLGWTDGTCPYCARGQENLCERARFTGKDIDGGYAE